MQGKVKINENMVYDLQNFRDFLRTCQRVLWTLLPGWCSHHQSMTQSLCFFTNFIGWRLPRESSTNSLFRRDSATIPRWRVPLVCPQGLRSSSLSVIIITDRPSYTVFDCRRPSFSGCRCCSCLERTTPPRHVCILPASFLSVASELVSHSFPDIL